MRLTVISFGSRGDVQPMAALAVALRDAGHDVRFVTHSNFASFIEGLGLDFVPVRVDSRAILESEAGQRWLAAHGGSFRSSVSMIRQFVRLLVPWTVELTRVIHEACGDADALAGNGITYFVGHSVAEARGIPFFMSELQPTELTKAFPSTFFKAAPRWMRLGGGVYNLLTHWTSGMLLWQGLRPSVNEARRDVLGLEAWPTIGPFVALQKLGVPVLGAYSPALVPTPSDSPPTLHVTGTWILERTDDWRPPGALERFLEAGPPPVCVGFGSMLGPDPAGTTQAVLSALDRSGQRGLLLTGWGGLDDDASGGAKLPDTVLPIEHAPHEWLFPRCAAAVHHCGAGTTAAGVRAGVPAVPVPFYADQPFWAARLHEAGVASAPIPFHELGANRLAAAIREVTADADLRRRAVDLGAEARSEPGAMGAVGIIEDYVRGEREAAG